MKIPDMNGKREKDELLIFKSNMDFPKIEWDEFLKFIGYTDKNIKGNVEQLKFILSPFLVDLYKYKFNMPIDLSKRIDMFEDWFSKNSFFRYYGIDVKTLICKLASWYEMRYSDSILEEMLSSGRIDIFNCFDFNENQYVHDSFSDDSDVYYLELSKTLDFNFFIKSLSENEKEVFRKKKLFVSFVKDNNDATYFLTSNGFIDSVLSGSNGICDKCYVAKHVTDVLDFRDDSIDVYINSTRERFKKSVLYSYKSAFVRQEVLNCAMYQLLLNHNTEFGTLRSLLFAREFGLDIDIPMIYGINRDNYVRQEINFYLKFGGSKNLNCYRNYFYDEYQNGNEPLERKPISDIMSGYCGCYTAEEKFLQQKLCDVLASKVSSSKELYQKLADVLYSCIDQDELAKEKARLTCDEDALRRRQVIQRRLEKKLNMIK